jgi:hypothetical protein
MRYLISSHINQIQSNTNQIQYLYKNIRNLDFRPLPSGPGPVQKKFLPSFGSLGHKLSTEPINRPNRSTPWKVVVRPTDRQTDEVRTIAYSRKYAKKKKNGNYNSTICNNANFNWKSLKSQKMQIPNIFNYFSSKCNKKLFYVIYEYPLIGNKSYGFRAS